MKSSHRRRPAWGDVGRECRTGVRMPVEKGPRRPRTGRRAAPPGPGGRGRGRREAERGGQPDEACRAVRGPCRGPAPARWPSSRRRSRLRPPVRRRPWRSAVPSQAGPVRSFQEAVLIDIAVGVDPDIEVVFLDTGSHFEETLEYVEAVRERYGLNLTVAHPVPGAEDHPCGSAQCCEFRKVRPLQAALAGKDAWVTGLKRSDAPTRRHAPIVAYDESWGMVKINPLATWTHQDLVGYVAITTSPSTRCAPRATCPSAALRPPARWPKGSTSVPAGGPTRTRSSAACMSEMTGREVTKDRDELYGLTCAAPTAPCRSSTPTARRGAERDRTVQAGATPPRDRRRHHRHLLEGGPGRYRQGPRRGRAPQVGGHLPAEAGRRQLHDAGQGARWASSPPRRPGRSGWPPTPSARAPTAPSRGVRVALRRPHHPPDGADPLAPDRGHPPHLASVRRRRPHHRPGLWRLGPQRAVLPVSGVDAGEAFDALPIARAVSDFFTGNREYANLPRKFKMSVSGCLEDCAQAEINDIGLWPARAVDGSLGFNLLVGGGLSDGERMASDIDVFVAQDQAVKSPGPSPSSSVSWATARTGAWPGCATWSRSSDPRASVPNWPSGPVDLVPAGEELTRRYRGDHVGVHPQKEDGRLLRGLFRAGRAHAGHGARRGGPSGRRLRRRHPAGRHRPEHHLHRVSTATRSTPCSPRPAGQVLTLPGPVSRGVVACTGSEFCRYAVVETKERAVKWARFLDEQLAGEPVGAPPSPGEFSPLGEDAGVIRMHFSGCSASCAQPQIADIGFRGDVAHVGDHLSEAVDIGMGGRSGPTPGSSTGSRAPVRSTSARRPAPGGAPLPVRATPRRAVPQLGASGAER